MTYTPNFNSENITNNSNVTQETAKTNEKQQTTTDAGQVADVGGDVMELGLDVADVNVIEPAGDFFSGVSEFLGKVGDAAGEIIGGILNDLS